jgi:tRNA-uridine 2-sulfurtransferase
MRAYVVSTDVDDNTITVTDEREADVLYTKRFAVDDRHWIGAEKTLPYQTGVKIRYRQPDPVSATLQMDGERMTVVLEEPQRAVASGQFVVAYDGDEVIGSGVIETGN